MSDAAPRRARHFRGRPRPRRILPVQYALLDAQGRPGELHRTETRNLGVGGAFVVTETPPPVGTRLLLRLGPDLPDVEGEVRWIAEPPHERGMGVRFFPLSPADLLALVSFLGPIDEPPSAAGQ